MQTLPHVAQAGTSPLAQRKLTLAQMQQLIDNALESIYELDDDKQSIAMLLSSINANAESFFNTVE